LKNQTNNYVTTRFFVH